MATFPLSEAEDFITVNDYSTKAKIIIWLNPSEELDLKFYLSSFLEEKKLKLMLFL